MPHLCLIPKTTAHKLERSNAIQQPEHDAAIKVLSAGQDPDCSGIVQCNGRKERALLTAAPVLQPRHPQICKTFHNVDCTGNRVIGLSYRSDVLAPHIGRSAACLKWCLLAQRLYDSITLEKMFVPCVLDHPDFTTRNLVLLRHAFSILFISCPLRLQIWAQLAPTAKVPCIKLCRRIHQWPCGCLWVALVFQRGARSYRPK